MTRLASVCCLLLSTAVAGCSDDTSPAGGAGGTGNTSNTSAANGSGSTSASGATTGSGTTTSATTAAATTTSASSSATGGGPMPGPDATVAVRFTGGAICHRSLTQIAPAPDGWIVAGSVGAAEDDLNAPCSIVLGATVIEPPHAAQTRVDFVAKLSTAGAVQWAYAYASHTGNGLRDVVVDGAGDVNVAGRLRLGPMSTVSWHKLDALGAPVMVDAPQVPFDPQHVRLAPDGDLVFASSSMVAKHATDGALQALTTFDFGGVSGDTISGLAIAPDGSVFFSGPAASAATGFDMGIAMVDEHLNPVWSKVLGGSDDQSVHGLASDGATGVFAVGNFTTQLLLGALPLAGSGTGFEPNGFFGHLDVTGTPDRALAFGTSVSSSCCSGPSIASWPGGDVVIGGGTYVTGGSGGALDFGGGPIAVTDNAFLARWSMSGAPAWARVFDGRARIDEVAIAADGTIGVVGMAYTAIDLGTGPLPVNENGYGDVFFATFPAE